MKFEYKIGCCWGKNEEHRKYLNDMGSIGWELVSVLKESDSTFITYFFKRININTNENQKD